ncbi:hypothetical protein N0V95_009469 [Ascochyta clinopodiicola]|nr:hypothetical protein N0V95_009469 [Ascochyta clinopodiicola]
MSHAAAIFWGSDLTVIGNTAWTKARGKLDGQGTSALRSYRAEALSTLQRVVRGRTVKVGKDQALSFQLSASSHHTYADARFFLDKLSNEDAEAQLHLSTLLDDKGSRQGVLAQLMRNSSAEKYTGLEGFDRLASRNPAKMDKNPGSDRPYGKSNDGQVDAMQTQLFQRFAELLPNGLAILDKELEAIFVNDGFFRLTTNKMANEFRAWPESIHPDDYDRVMSAYRKAFSSREELRIEFRCTSEAAGEAGEWRLFLFRPLSDDPEAGFICAVVDITEIKQAQLAQEKAATEAQDRKEQQERFIDMVSHEIRNPLSAVMHLAEEVKDITLVRPKWEFSQALKVFQSEFKAKSIKFHYAMDISYDDQEVDHVVADLNRMKQVLVNLITNAVKFTSRKKGNRSITVSMGASTERPTSYPPNVIYFGQDKESFHVDSTRSPEWGTGDAFYLMVAVKDSGIGISKEDQAKLFERFRQATPKTQEKYGGSGLGLFISRKLCQLHGGDIGVSSKEGDGSTFGFFFKARRSNGSSEDGRPVLSSRSNSESQGLSNQRAQTPRPGYSRSNSQLPGIKERTNEHGKEEVKVEAKESTCESESKKDKSHVNGERPGLGTLTSHTGVDVEDVNSSLENPPTEYLPEAHPESTEDHRYQETQSIAEQITPSLEGNDDDVPYTESGETKRQGVAARKAHKAQGTQRSEDKRTLLLVEDNLINQKVLRRQLQARGFEVFVANNGQEAIDAVSERGATATEDQHNRNYFDCILMDQEMPIKDGNQATTEIRQLQEDGKAGYSKILGVSANVREAQRTSMREAGMDDLISKPFKVDDLIKKIDGLTIKEQEGKLAREVKLKTEDVQMMKGEKETLQEEKREGGQEEKKPGQEQQEKREAKQSDAREEREADGRKQETAPEDKRETAKQGDGKKG